MLTPALLEISTKEALVHCVKITSNPAKSSFFFWRSLKTPLLITIQGTTNARMTIETITGFRIFVRRCVKYSAAENPGRKGILHDLVFLSDWRPTLTVAIRPPVAEAVYFLHHYRAAEKGNPAAKGTTSGPWTACVMIAIYAARGTRWACGGRIGTCCARPLCAAIVCRGDTNGGADPQDRHYYCMFSFDCVHLSLLLG